MRTSNVAFAAVVVVVAVSLLCVWFYPSAQDFMASNSMWNGIRQFSKELNASDINSLDAVPDLVDNTALVAIPYLQYSNDELSKLKRFVDDGGTLVLMDDYGYGNTVLEYLGVSARFTHEPLLDPLFCYKNPNLPEITDFAPGVKEANIKVVLLNHATTLTNVADSQVLAWSSGDSFLDANENGNRDRDEPEGPFAVAAGFGLGKGTLVLVSDPSILINASVGRNDNYDFIRYLTSTRSNQRAILMDTSHLTKAPLDVSKTRLTNTRKLLSNPYSLLGITAIIFLVVSRYSLKKGDFSG